jgi:hypothetical protein
MRQQGSAIAQVIMAIAALSGVTYFTIENLDRSHKVNNTTKISMIVENTTDQIRQFIEKPDLCRNTLKNSEITPGIKLSNTSFGEQSLYSFPRIPMADILKTGDKIQNTSITFAGAMIKSGTRLYDFDYPISGVVEKVSVYDGKLFLKYNTKLKNLQSVGGEKIGVIPLKIYKRPSGELLACYPSNESIPAAEEAFCRTLANGYTQSFVYYPIPAAGVPKCQLLALYIGKNIPTNPLPSNTLFVEGDIVVAGTKICLGSTHCFSQGNAALGLKFLPGSGANSANPGIYNFSHDPGLTYLKSPSALNYGSFLVYPTVDPSQGVIIK